jgi:biopolymer transport protein ExbD
MRLRRQIRNRTKRKKKGPIDLDITSLLDVLVIMLIFLLKSYNTSSVTLSIPEGIKLPTSTSQNLSTAGVMIQVSESNIWVDSKNVLDSSQAPKRLYDQGKRRIIPLYNELVRKRQEIQAIAKATKNAKKFSGVANLIVDKSLKYSYLKKLMYTCAVAGYKQYKFVVLSEDI